MTDVTQLVEDRGQDYGHPYQNHGCTAALWAAYLARRHGVMLPLDYRDVVWLNVLQKISRDAHRPKPDNVDDVMGYAETLRIADEVATARPDLTWHVAPEVLEARRARGEPMAGTQRSCPFGLWIPEAPDMLRCVLPAEHEGDHQFQDADLFAATERDAASCFCPRCHAPYEVVRPGKIQPSCTCGLDPAVWPDEEGRMP